MVTFRGANRGELTMVAQAIVPAEQFPLSQTVLGINNWGPGIIPNEVHAAQPSVTYLMNLTAAVYGASPSPGATLTVAVAAAGSAVVSTPLNTAALTGDGTQGTIIDWAEGQYIIPDLVDITMVGTSSAWTQLAGSGICLTLWGLAVI